MPAGAHRDGIGTYEEAGVDTLPVFVVATLLAADLPSAGRSGVGDGGRRLGALAAGRAVADGYGTGGVGFAGMYVERVGQRGVRAPQSPVGPCVKKAAVCITGRSSEKIRRNAF
jgi:hypothetical protein